MDSQRHRGRRLQTMIFVFVLERLCGHPTILLTGSATCLAPTSMSTCNCACSRTADTSQDCLILLLHLGLTFVTAKEVVKEGDNANVKPPTSVDAAGSLKFWLPASSPARYNLDVPSQLPSTSYVAMYRTFPGHPWYFRLAHVTDIQSSICNSVRFAICLEGTFSSTAS